MGKSKLSGAFIVIGAFVIVTLSAFSSKGQVVVRQDTLPVKPAAIFQILKPSCIPCHSRDGKDKPRNALNFSVWEQYTPMERTMLASSIRSEIQSKSMPPKGFLNSHPAAALSEMQVKQLVLWCDSIKARP